MIVETLVVALAFGVLWVTFFYAIPSMFRLLAIYRLHDARDRVFEIGLQYPSVRDTRIYRDVDVLMAGALHVVRERSFGDSLNFLATINRSQDDAVVAEQRAKYEASIADFSDEERAQFKKLLLNFMDSQKAVAVRGLTGHPLMSVFAVVVLLVVKVVGFFSKDDDHVEKPAPTTAVENFTEPVTIPGPRRYTAAMLLLTPFIGRKGGRDHWAPA